MMGFTGSIASIIAKRDWSDLGKLLRQMQREIDALKTAQPYAMASRNFDGTLDPPALGTQGWALTRAGDAIIGSNLLLGGQLIDDGALQHPTRVGMNFADLNSTNFTVAGANFAAATIAVPSGFTTAQITCIATVGDGRNVGAGDSPLYGQAWIGKVGAATTGSAVIAATVKDGTASSLTMGWMAVLTGLTGSDSVQGGAWAAVDTTAGWISGAANGHAVVAATFYR